MIVIVMGVVGAGKTTVGKLLATHLGWEFADADDFHSTSNIEKIRNGIPLDDADREPWLDRMRTAILEWSSAGHSAVLACSALKKTYRSRLKVAPEVRFVYLKGSKTLIAERLRARHGHFAGEAILASQLSDLEEPDSAGPEDALTISIAATPIEIVGEIRRKLGLE